MLKKNSNIKFLGSLCLMVMSSSALASEGNFYVSAKGGYSGLAELSSKAQTVKTEGVTVNGNVLETTVKKTVKVDPGFNGGILFGRDFGGYRIEGELSYIRANLKSLKSVKTFNNKIYRGEDKTEKFKDTTFSAINIGVNGYYDIKTSTEFTPFVGLGLGTSIAKIKDKKDSKRKFSKLGAFQAMVGTHYSLTKELSIMLEYRFSGTSKFTYNEQSEAEKKEGFKDLKSFVLINSINLGAKYIIA